MLLISFSVLTLAFILKISLLLLLFKLLLLLLLFNVNLIEKMNFNIKINVS
jgi:hypothetical protein